MRKVIVAVASLLITDTIDAAQLRVEPYSLISDTVMSGYIEIAENFTGDITNTNLDVISGFDVNMGGGLTLSMAAGGGIDIKGAVHFDGRELIVEQADFGQRPNEFLISTNDGLRGHLVGWQTDSIYGNSSSEYASHWYHRGDLGPGLVVAKIVPEPSAELLAAAGLAGVWGFLPRRARGCSATETEATC